MQSRQSRRLNRLESRIEEPPGDFDIVPGLSYMEVRAQYAVRVRRWRESRSDLTGPVAAVADIHLENAIRNMNSVLTARDENHPWVRMAKGEIPIPESENPSTRCAAGNPVSSKEVTDYVSDLISNNWEQIQQKLHDQERQAQEEGLSGSA